MHLSTISLALTRIGMGGPLQGAAMLQDFTSGNQTLDPRITFTRASNATVVGKDGTIQYAPHNLLSYSEQFDNAAWSKSNSTVTANAVVAPDGTTTADSIIVTTGGSTDTGVRITTTQAASTVYTTSVYAKYLNTRYLVIRNLAVGATLGAQWVFFDLINGRVGVTGTGITASITSVGNGWYRCSATATTLSTITNNLVDYRLSDVDGSYTVTTGSNIYLWGAQLNVGALQPYYPTTVKNLLGYTQEFDNAAWTKSNSFVQTNQIRNNTMQGAVAGTPGTLPTNWGGNSVGLTRTVVGTGTENGVAYIDVRFNGTTTSQFGSITFEPTNTIAASAAQAWTGSFYARIVSGSLTNVAQAGIAFYYRDSGGVFLNSSNGPVTITSSLARYSFSATTVASTAFIQPAFYFNGTNASGDAMDFTLRIGMPQLVQGASAGDVVATYGTAKAVMYQAPDGTMSADKLVENTATASHRVDFANAPISAGTQTLSIYLNAAERSAAQYQIDGTVGGVSSGVGVSVNLTTGAVTPNPSSGNLSLVSASTLSVGGGWYRLFVTFTSTATATGTVRAYIQNPIGTANYTGDGTSGIYIWGAQLSDSASLDPYVYNPGAAPAAAAYYGPRFDYDPVTLQPKGLLIEEQRTNLLTYSEQFDNAVWTKIGTVTANESTSPDGTLTADLVVTDGVGSAQVMQGATISSGATVTGSIYLKYNNVSGIEIVLLSNNNTTPYARSTFNIQTGVVSVAVTTANGGTNASSTITPIGNGWYRCSVTVTYPAVTAAGMRVNAATATGSYRAWGAQLEAGSFATSYIPTTTAQATRAADVATMTGANFSSWYNQSDGTLFAEVDSIATTLSNYPTCFEVSDGTSANWVGLSTNSFFNARAGMRSGGVSQVDMFAGQTLAGLPANTVTRYAFGYATNNSAASRMGEAVSTDTTCTVPSGLTQARIGSSVWISQWNGHIRRLAYWNRRLSNAELQGVTA